MRADEGARFIVAAALRAGRDPLLELGLPAAPMTVRAATLLFDLIKSKDKDEMSTSASQEEQAAIDAEVEREEAWAAATGEEEEEVYGGPRGVTPPGATRISVPLTDPAAPPAAEPTPTRWPVVLRLGLWRMRATY